MFPSPLKALLLAGLVATALPAFAQPSDPIEREALTAYLKKALHHDDSFKDRFDAEVWLLDMSQRLSRRLPDAEDRLALLRSIHREARAASLPPEMVLALIEVESAFDRFAISRVGAQGLMQVMPFWKKEIGRPDDNLTDPDTNLRYGCQILQFYLQREKGHLRRALARYNGSLGKNWYPDRVFSAWRQHWYNGPLSYRGIDD